VFGQAARLAFYYFLAISPALLLLLLVLKLFASTGFELRNALLDSFQQVLPREVSALIAKAVTELNSTAAVGLGALSAAAGAGWATLNGTWAMMAGLNRAYGVQENRRGWRIAVIAIALTVSLQVMGLVMLGAMLGASFAGSAVRQHLGVDAHSVLLWRMIQWPLIATFLLLSFASVYRFGPNLKDRRWEWSLPGAALATTVWIASTLLLRIYDERFNAYQRIYGPLEPAAVLLLWFYVTGAAILVGGEANSEIEKAAAEAHHSDVRRPEEGRSGGADAA
jgi:membrane protein